MNVMSLIYKFLIFASVCFTVTIDLKLNLRNHQGGVEGIEALCLFFYDVMQLGSPVHLYNAVK